MVIHVTGVQARGEAGAWSLSDGYMYSNHIATPKQDAAKYETRMVVMVVRSYFCLILLNFRVGQFFGIFFLEVTLYGISAYALHDPIAGIG